MFDDFRPIPEKRVRSLLDQELNSHPKAAGSVYGIKPVTAIALCCVLTLAALLCAAFPRITATTASSFGGQTLPALGATSQNTSSLLAAEQTLDNVEKSQTLAALRDESAEISEADYASWNVKADDYKLEDNLSADQFQIGALSVTSNGAIFQIQHDKKILFAVNAGQLSFSSRYYIILDTENLSKLSFRDGEPRLENCRPGEGHPLLPIANESGQLAPLSRDSLPLLPFFSEEPNTLALLDISHGASGGGSLRMLFIDTQDGFQQEILSEILRFPQWISQDLYPPAYVTYQRRSIGARVFDLGADLVKEAHFPRGRRYYSDAEITAKIFSAEFAKNRLAADELQILGGLDMNQSNFQEAERAVVSKLIRLSYYGRELGFFSEVNSLQTGINRSVLEELVAARLADQEILVVEQQRLEESPSKTEVNEFAGLTGLPADRQLAQELPKPNPKFQYELARNLANQGNIIEARRAWTHLAQDGYAPAQTALGLTFARGHGTARDFQIARMWFEKAAEQNDSQALFNLGKLYHNGDGVSRDLIKSRWYLERAAKLGNRSAAELLTNPDR